MKPLGIKTNRPRSQKGLVAIELALGFFAFWLICLVWVEMSFVSYTSALGDLMISKASSEAKRGEANFDQAFEDALKQSDSLWEHLVDSEDFKTCVYYVADFSALKNLSNTAALCGDSGQGVVGDNSSPIAIYQVSYRYTPTFSAVFTKTDSIFTREMIVIQESSL